MHHKKDNPNIESMSETILICADTITNYENNSLETINYRWGRTVKPDNQNLFYSSDWNSSFIIDFENPELNTINDAISYGRYVVFPATGENKFDAINIFIGFETWFNEMNDCKTRSYYNITPQNMLSADFDEDCEINYTDNNSANPNLNVHPNQLIGTLFYLVDDVINIQLYDLSGNNLHINTNEAEKKIIIPNNIKNGLYLIKINTTNNSFSKLGTQLNR